MYNNVALVALPLQDLIRPPGVLAILAAACEEHNVNYTVNDVNLWLFRQLDLGTWNNINDNWNSVDPFTNRETDWYQKFLQLLQQYVDHLMSTGPDLITISVFSDMSACCTVEMIRMINAHPDRLSTKIIIGGSGIRAQLSLFDNKELCTELLNRKDIDYFIFGEGEQAFREMLTGNVTYPGINNYNAIQIDDLNQYPFPSYAKIDLHSYNYVGQPEIVITGSRGCVRKCTYCDVAKYWPKYRYRSGQKIADELYHYYKTTGIKSFEFSDSLINGSLKQFKEMNLALLQYQVQDTNFKISYKGQYICRSKNSMNENDYRNMKQAGCDYVYVGIESFSDRVRFDMDKKFTNVDLDFHLKMCGRYGIKNSLLMLVGYPTETDEDHQQNLDTMRRYQPYAQSGVISMIALGYTAGILNDTPLYHMQHQLEIVPEFELIDNFISSNWISLKNPSLTLAKRIQRWIELNDMATTLGYNTPRNKHYLSRFIQMLQNTNNKKKIFSIQASSKI